MTNDDTKRTIREDWITEATAKRYARHMKIAREAHFDAPTDRAAVIAAFFAARPNIY
jgi:hypothetical protein